MHRLTTTRLALVAVIAALFLLMTVSPAFGGVNRYEETTPSPVLVYTGTWTQAAGTEFSGGFVRYNTTSGNSAVLAFTGTGIDYYAATSTMQNQVRVELDGVSQGVFNLNSPVRTSVLVWGIRGLENRSHTLRIVNVTPYVNLDAFDVYTPSDITASAGANGSVSPGGAVSVDHGAEQLFTIAADTGYEIEDVLVDGVSVGAVSSYTFTNVTAPHTISASFKSAPVVSTPASSPWSLALGLLGGVAVAVTTLRRFVR